MKKYNILFLVLFFLLIPFSYGASLNGSNSIYTFNVTNCQVNETLVGCSPASMRFQCDITNSAFIDFTEFLIDGVLYNASRVGQTWHYDYVKPNQTSTVNTTINLTRIYVTDTNSDTAVFDEDNVSTRHDCEVCTDVGVADACSVFDNTTFRHVFEPSGCQVDFNESVSCNYCSQDLQQTLGECNVNNTQSVQYSDLNYFSCCTVTGIGSDCDILDYPYNETTTQSCSYLTQDFACDFPNVSEYGEKMPFSCLLNDTDNYQCVVNVFEDNRLLQVNPEFKDYSTGLLTISGKPVESKEFFTPENRLLNVYFTNKNLLTDDQYLVEVKCSGNTNVVTSQYLTTPFYEELGVLNRVVWAKENVGTIVALGLIVLLFVVLLAWALSSLRRGRISR